ncbi:MAG: FlxA-like family protein [Bacteroides sp.]|nr:FlxA-like family protein [Bacteroides sp.]
MNISGIQTQSNTSYQGVSKQQGDDPAIKNAQGQIEELRKQLQQLAENEEMDPKTKTEKKQQIQQQISDLNAQIRQRQAELRREKQAAVKDPQRAAEKVEKNNENTKSNGFSKASASALISASNALDNADALESLNKKLSGRARELSAEIETDMKRGADVTAKQSELEKVQKGVKNTRTAHAELLSEADETLENAAETDRAVKEKEKTDEKNDEREIKTEGTYDKDGALIEAEDKDGKDDFEDKA